MPTNAPHLKVYATEEFVLLNLLDAVKALTVGRGTIAVSQLRKRNEVFEKREQIMPPREHTETRGCTALEQFSEK